MRKSISLAAVALCASLSVAAAPVNFDVTTGAFTPGTGYGIDGNEAAGSLLNVGFNASLANYSFALTNPGDSATFQFGSVVFSDTLTILAAEASAVGGRLDVSADFTFTDPLNGVRTLTATGNAVVGGINDAAVDYSINWNPVVVLFSGGAFSINMNSLSFTDNNVTLVQNATIRLIANNTVPEPASLALAGLALVGVGLSRRRGVHAAG